MSEQYSIKIPVFEGPLDLLLHLIKKNEVDIYDIPISLITHQYLEYIGLMKELNLEVAGEFLVMAATLIQIKSKMLLPVEEQQPEAPAEDPRLELVQRLLEYQAFKEASLDLREMGLRWSDVLYRTDVEEGSAQEEDSMLLFDDLSMFDLISAFKKILEKAPQELQLISREALSVNDRISRIIARLEEKETVRFEEFFDFQEAVPKSHLIITFVAILEILKLGLARVYQEDKFGTIWVIRAKDTDAPDLAGPGSSAEPEFEAAVEGAAGNGQKPPGDWQASSHMAGDTPIEDSLPQADLDDEAWYRDAAGGDGEDIQ